jgi:hypothetical protein
MLPGIGFTVTVCVAEQLPTVYDIVAVPILDTPDDTRPDVPTVTIAVLLLLHVPPAGVLSLREVDEPRHILAVPRIAPGAEFTLTTTDLEQPVAVTEYTTVVVPTLKPLTKPLVPIEPTPGVLLLHTPPPVASVSCVVEPWHTVVVPLIPVIGFTVANTVV